MPMIVLFSCATYLPLYILPSTSTLFSTSGGGSSAGRSWLSKRCSVPNISNFQRDLITPKEAVLSGPAAPEVLFPGGNKTWVCDQRLRFPPFTAPLRTTRGSDLSCQDKSTATLSWQGPRCLPSSVVDCFVLSPVRILSYIVPHSQKRSVEVLIHDERASSRNTARLFLCHHKYREARFLESRFREIKSRGGCRAPEGGQAAGQESDDLW